jgi:hypothetical protein
LKTRRRTGVVTRFAIGTGWQGSVTVRDRSRPLSRGMAGRDGSPNPGGREERRGRRGFFFCVGFETGALLEAAKAEARRMECDVGRRRRECKTAACSWGLRSIPFWLRVPPNRIIDRTDNPTNRGVVCFTPEAGILCFVRPAESYFNSCRCGLIFFCLAARHDFQGVIGARGRCSAFASSHGATYPSVLRPRDS